MSLTPPFVRPLLRPLVAVSTILAALGIALTGAGPASAAPTTVTATVGPVPITGVPLSICISSPTTSCTPTPPATGVALTVSATIPNEGTPPTISLGACPSGQQGVALVVTTGSSPAGISALVILTGLDGTSTYIPIVLPPSGPSQTIVIGVCVPAPSLPGLPVLGGLGGLVNGLVTTVLTLLGLPG